MTTAPLDPVRPARRDCRRGGAARVGRRRRSRIIPSCRSASPCGRRATAIRGCSARSTRIAFTTIPSAGSSSSSTASAARRPGRRRPRPRSRCCATRLERETGEIEDRVREAIAIANNEVHRLASLRPEWQGMACVLTIAVVGNGGLVVGHVGDTRLYKLRRRPHRQAHARSFAGRRARGCRRALRGRRDAAPAAQRGLPRRRARSITNRTIAQFIDILHVPFEPDAALLLCSDGLTDLRRRRPRFRRSSSDYAGHPYEIVRALIDAANDAGGKDNVTVVYAEGPRFTQGEETRDLRTRRTAPRRRPSASRSLKPRAPPRDSCVSRTAGRRGGCSGRSPWRCWRCRHSRCTRCATGSSRATMRRGPGRPPRRSRCRPAESIAAALARAAAGTVVVVEPGEYRERLRAQERRPHRQPRAARRVDPAAGRRVRNRRGGGRLRRVRRGAVRVPDHRRRRHAARHRGHSCATPT